MPASSSMGRASGRRLPPTRSPACARRCATTRPWRDMRGNTMARMSSVSGRHARPDQGRARLSLDVWLATAMTEPRYVRRLAKIRALEDGAEQRA